MRSPAWHCRPSCLPAADPGPAHPAARHRQPGAHHAGRGHGLRRGAVLQLDGLPHRHDVKPHLWLPRGLVQEVSRPASQPARQPDDQPAHQPAMQQLNFTYNVIYI